jgi:phosphoglycolate phosphatase
LTRTAKALITPLIFITCMEPDLLPFLERIKPLYHTAISTNRTDTMEIILDTFALRPWFDMVVTATNRPTPQAGSRTGS